MFVTSLRTCGATSFMAKNKGVRNTTERLEIKKFCPHCNKMTLHKEIK